jgi:hypothetical protein
MVVQASTEVFIFIGFVSSICLKVSSAFVRFAAIAAQALTLHNGQIESSVAKTWTDEEFATILAVLFVVLVILPFTGSLHASYLDAKRRKTVLLELDDMHDGNDDDTASASQFVDSLEGFDQTREFRPRLLTRREDTAAAGVSDTRSRWWHSISFWSRQASSQSEEPLLGDNWRVVELHEPETGSEPKPQVGVDGASAVDVGSASSPPTIEPQPEFEPNY